MTDLPTEPLGGRYRILEPLGQGAFGRTFRGRDETRGVEVAIKVLDPSRAADWKVFELFEREAAVLRSLRHHGVPEIVDALRTDWSGRAVHALVMEFVAGESLARTIESGRRLDRATVLHLFAELLGVLDYLHGRVPPILHRDIKPANVIVRPDGSPALVDFGSVRVTLDPGDGSTVAGTYGYMPYEQFHGQATPASDLYGLGATFLHLVTGVPPARFLTDGNRIAVPEELPGGEPLRGILAAVLEPAPAARPQSAAVVRAMLFGAAPRPGVTLAPPGRGVLLDRPAITLPPGPRAIEGPTRALLDKIAPSAWRVMNASSRGTGPVDFNSALLIGLFSIVTAGVLPLWFLSIARSRRRRARMFLERGILADAVILGMEAEDIGFQEKLTRVRYQFSAEGRVVRGSDAVLPALAERWEPGERIQVLYLPDRDDESLIVSVA